MRNISTQEDMHMKRFNIYMRKDGRWEGRIYHTEPNTKKRRYKAFFGRSREETERKMLAFQAQHHSTATVFVTFSQLYREWRRSIRHRIKESTAANYALKADKHILPKFGSKQVTSILAADIYDFIRQYYCVNSLLYLHFTIIF